MLASRNLLNFANHCDAKIEEMTAFLVIDHIVDAPLSVLADKDQINNRGLVFRSCQPERSRCSHPVRIFRPNVNLQTRDLIPILASTDRVSIVGDSYVVASSFFIGFH